MQSSCKKRTQFSPYSAGRRGGGAVGLRQQLDLDLGLATEGGATARQAPWEGARTLPRLRCLSDPTPTRPGTGSPGQM